MLIFHTGVHAWMSPGTSLVIRYLHSGNGVCDLTSENYTAGAMHMSAGKDVFAVSQMHVWQCLIAFAKSVMLLQLVFGKANILSLAA